MPCRIGVRGVPLLAEPVGSDLVRRAEPQGYLFEAPRGTPFVAS